MIKLKEKLSEEKLLEVTNDLERLKKLTPNFNRQAQIKALQRLIEANNNIKS